MRAEIVVAVLGGALVGTAFGALPSCTCTRGEQNAIAPVPEGPADASLPSPAPKTNDAGAPEVAADAGDAAETSSPIALPPLDTKCTVDADCDYVAVALSGPYTCCAWCGTTIGSKTWAAAVRSTCAASLVALSNPCPPLACPMGPTKSRCDGGTCVPKW
jgi:hypothetical protein